MYHTTIFFYCPYRYYNCNGGCVTVLFVTGMGSEYHGWKYVRAAMVIR
jgi:hypothetical protein